MADEAPVADHHAVDGANGFGFGAQVVKVVDNLLLVGEGDVEAVEAALP